MSLLIKTRAGLSFKSIKYDCAKQVAGLKRAVSPKRGRGSYQDAVCTGADQNAGNDTSKCCHFIGFGKRAREG